MDAAVDRDSFKMKIKTCELSLALKFSDALETCTHTNLVQIYEEEKKWAISLEFMQKKNRKMILMVSIFQTIVDTLDWDFLIAAKSLWHDAFSLAP